MATDAPRRSRPAARILLVDAAARVLLFRFTPADRAPFWVTPGGALDPGEAFAAAARRELIEEVGIDRDPGLEVARRTIAFRSLEGDEVVGDERYFRIDIDTCEVDPARHTPLERRVMQSWHWFTRDEIGAHAEPIYPTDLLAMLDQTEPDR